MHLVVAVSSVMYARVGQGTVCVCFRDVRVVQVCGGCVSMCCLCCHVDAEWIMMLLLLLFSCVHVSVCGVCLWCCCGVWRCRVLQCMQSVACL